MKKLAILLSNYGYLNLSTNPMDTRPLQEPFTGKAKHKLLWVSLGLGKVCSCDLSLIIVEHMQLSQPLGVS